MELTHTLFRRFPTLASGDPEAHADAAMTIADILGCLLARGILESSDMKMFDSVLLRLMERVRSSATEVAEAAAKTLRQAAN